ncbi:hypothetical protein K9U39_07905 [Rhodoblastus acidophilus]|uniref:Uncharacterized protein n=1 Tax=Candidatus Rhodoblastus alkanivorans TaxID=2954117 RepID=A0ABS9Z7E2_9HYPH|nr:hypothetical protein [Candidatus Rhodoblastus alkanivorans]MCI4678296.1 hypothetical protein [Candidatus Rhodoblastus alkanivorans]MCI4683554.1 hypothetical protein [Candidatus Rhodoblastus alkanivorans]MDI4640869.1 hypothetical protein [Rhodoblastus acidophilus]
MPAFYPFLYGDQGELPEQNADDYRLSSFIGAIGSDELVPGPILDTADINDIHNVLMLVGLSYEEMQTVRRNDGAATRFGWTGCGPILAISPAILFALGQPAARDFLLDLKTAAEMVKAIRPHEQDGGCVFEIVLPQGG